MRDSIPLDKDMGFLIPLGSLFLENTDIISLLAKWRVEALTFPNKFAVTAVNSRNVAGKIFN